MEDEDTQSCYNNMPKLDNVQSYCEDVKQEPEEEQDLAALPAPTFSNQNSNGTDYNFFGSSSSLSARQSSPSSRSTSSSCDNLVDMSIGSLVWARFVGDEETEPGSTFYYPALIKHILDNRR